tara:strand:- start:102 stop:617 length:516 start_codon:yes stop_codon:yes gene_type:complete
MIFVEYIMIPDLLFNLNVIGQIKSSDKLILNSGILYIDPFSYTRAIRRKLLGQNRYNIMVFINTIINYTLIYCKSISDKIISHNNSVICFDLIKPNMRNDLIVLYESLNHVVKGLGRLKNSYINDKYITEYIDKISLQISNYLVECNLIGIHNYLFSKERNFRDTEQSIII